MIGPIQSNPIILYDGICGLCNRLVQFVLERDHQDRFRFAALQSNFARNLLQRNDCNPDDLDTFYLALYNGQPNIRLISRNYATAAVLKELSSILKYWGGHLTLLPAPGRD